MKKIKVSIILNIIIFVLVIMSTIFMFTGFEFMGHNIPLQDTKLSVFKYFTVDSNILVGISSLLLLIYEILFIKKGKSIPRELFIFKYLGTTSVLLTFLVTTFFLAPFSVFNFLDFYKNSNFFFHFLIPVISGISFIFFEKNNISFKETFLSIIPMFIYALIYMINVFTHLENGAVSYEYDFYWFLRGGINTVFIVVPVIFISTYLIGFITWKLNHKINN